MKKVIRKLWKDEDGFVISMELVLVATILVLGLVAGLGQVRDSLVGELADIAQAIGAIDQTFGFGGVSNTITADGSNGSQFTDVVDASLGDTGPVGTDGSGIVLTSAGLTISAAGEGGS